MELLQPLLPGLSKEATIASFQLVDAIHGGSFTRSEEGWPGKVARNSCVKST